MRIAVWAAGLGRARSMGVGCWSALWSTPGGCIRWGAVGGAQCKQAGGCCNKFQAPMVWSAFVPTFCRGKPAMHMWGRGLCIHDYSPPCAPPPGQPQMQDAPWMTLSASAYAYAHSNSYAVPAVEGGPPFPGPASLAAMSSVYSDRAVLGGRRAGRGGRRQGRGPRIAPEPEVGAR